MPPKKRPKRSRFREQHKAVTMWLNDADAALVVEQAQREGRKLAAYFRFHGVEHARREKMALQNRAG